MQPQGLYIHVPFCTKRCTYCSFYSTTQGKETREAFVKALVREMRERPCSSLISTLYFGGGTPSQLDDQELEEIFTSLHQHYEISSEAEITFEANPDDLSIARAQHWASLGINRMSLGVQSFDEKILETLNRRHNAAQVYQAVEAIRQAGIFNVSLDLIYGLPMQTLTQWVGDVQEALSLDIQHLSAYALSYEAGTHLYQQLKQGKIQETSEELSLEMFKVLIALCKQRGLQQYEISNFSLLGKESRHNSSYWHGTPYIGLGPGAHSYDGKRIRRHNLENLSQYITGESEVPHLLEQLSDSERANEMIMTRLRTRQGLSMEHFQSIFGISKGEELLRAANPYVAKGWLQLEDKHLGLTPEGIFVSDYVMVDLMFD